MFTGLGFKPLGYERVTTLSAAKGLTVPSGAQLAIITVNAQSVRFRDDGVDPDAATGVLLPVTTAGLPFEYSGALGKIKFFETQASATLDVLYYRRGGE